jgi:hypothetical protein
MLLFGNIHENTVNSMDGAEQSTTMPVGFALRGSLSGYRVPRIQFDRRTRGTVTASGGGVAERGEATVGKTVVSGGIASRIPRGTVRYRPLPWYEDSMRDALQRRG